MNAFGPGKGIHNIFFERQYLYKKSMINNKHFRCTKKYMLPVETITLDFEHQPFSSTEKNIFMIGKKVN
jgi:hypothetical protein